MAEHDVATERPSAALRRETIIERCRQVINTVLAPARHAVAHVDSVPSTHRFARTLARAGSTPATVVDIGVAYGTPWLYATFPQARFHLVDPTRESLPHMKAWAKRLDAEVHNVALGAEAGTLTIATRSTIEHSSLLQDINQSQVKDRYVVEVRRFDEHFATLDGPVLVKIDVEGAELAVLEGMRRRLDAIDVVIVETSMNTLYEGGVEFAEIVGFFNEVGFCFADFVGLFRRPYDRALHQIDAVFVPKTSPLRVKRWD